MDKARSHPHTPTCIVDAHVMREQTRKNSAARVSSTEQESVQEKGERRRSGRVALAGLTTVALVAKGELGGIHGLGHEVGPHLRVLIT